MRKSLAMLAVPALAMGGLALAAAPAQAHAEDSWTYQATLNPLNNSTGSGTITITGHGNEATVTQSVTGLAAEFDGAPYPHVQHIHIAAQGVCPPPTADTNGDGVVSVTEGAPFYGDIGTTLTTSGDTSPATATDLKLAPSGGAYNYERTFTLSDDTVNSLKAGTAVVVVHGLDPATLSPEAQAAPSDIVPSLPLAATSPALCGTLTASQMGAMPQGAPDTGATPAAQSNGVETAALAAGGAGIAAAGLLGYAVYRRRATQR